MRIAVVGPSNTLSADVPAAMAAFVRARYGPGGPEVVFHPQCFERWGHFAGTDEARENAFVEVANDPDYDAVWFARGGYGANRIAERAIARMGDAALAKPFLGYSDCGFLLGGLMAKGIGLPVHAPMPSDIRREGGEAAVTRAIDWLLDPRPAERAQVAFNLTVFGHMLGTPLEPDLAGRVLLLEEVDEPLYRIDRALFHVTASTNVRRCTGIMLGRCTPVTPNEPDFASDEEAVARDWCTRSGIAWLGRAAIGHDADNIVVPFG